MPISERTAGQAVVTIPRKSRVFAVPRQLRADQIGQLRHVETLGLDLIQGAKLGGEPDGLAAERWPSSSASAPDRS